MVAEECLMMEKAMKKKKKNDDSAVQRWVRSDDYMAFPMRKK